MMVLVKFLTVFVVHFILILSVEVWTTGLQTVHLFFLMNYAIFRKFFLKLWLLILFGGKRFTGSKDTSRFISQLGNKQVPASVTLPISLFHTHLIPLHSKHDKQAMDMIPTSKKLYSNKVLSYSHWSSEETPSGINFNWVGSPETSSSLHSDPANNEEGYLQFRCRRIFKIYIIWNLYIWKHIKYLKKASL